MRARASFWGLVLGVAVFGYAGAYDLPVLPGGAVTDSLGLAPPPTTQDTVAVAPAPEPEMPLRPSFGNPIGPRFALPGFMQRPALRPDFQGTLKDQWIKAGSGRVFEGHELSLEDFSSIDIPLKFPQTIGRVIGQGANLSVTGSEQITFGGETRYLVNQPVTEYGTPSKFPQLNMKQHLKIDLKGTVGEKINVLVHHDSDVETPLENRIKLRYNGDDDEIVQTVEMGNTNLAIPGSQFVGYSEQHQGLFGAKVLGKLGPVDMTVIASKQEGRTAGASFVGAAARDSTVILDYDFVRNKYFFMIDPLDLRGGEVSDVQVYLDDGIGTNDAATGAIEAYAALDPNNPPQEASWADSTYHGFFNVLERNRDYAVDQLTGELSLLKALDPAYTLAVSYVYGGQKVGGPDGQKRLVLKMIRPAQQYAIGKSLLWGSTLKYERKNVYSVGSSYISEQKVKVRIFRKTGGDVKTVQRNFEYNKILGVDLQDENAVQATASNGWKTDGFADGGIINGEQGLLLFPDLRPFDPDIRLMTARPETLDDRNSKIYDAQMIDLKQEDSKYYIVVIYATPTTVYKLPNVSILEGSEAVTLNGRRLTRGVDYDIYYDVGQIKFKTEEAASPDAKIQVDYQYVPFLALAQQSLLGIQSTYKFSDQSYIGGAWIYQSKKSPEERPRLGQEPSQIMVGDISTQLQFTPDWLTALTDAIPIVQAQSPSRLSIAAEAAASFPNPNTKGEVYIDDMEGVQDLTSFTLLREAWVPASPPTDFRWEDNRKIWWYVKDKEVKEQDLFPEAESRPGEAFIPVLEINFRDFAYGWVIPDPDPAKQWAGLERLVSKTGSDFSELKFVEVWLRQKEGHGGKMYVDLGAISENYYHPWSDTLNTEDKDNNGKLSEEENTGLDGIPNGQPGDDQGRYEDDWSYNTEGDYSHINGTEKNPGLVPDTEDLDGNGRLDTDETFFRLAFDLSDTTYIVNHSGEWVHYRIPFADADTIGGSPSLKSIRYVRFFFAGVDTPAVYQLAYLQVSGASWLEEGLRHKEDMARVTPDTREIFEISAKNTRDDPDYIPPYDPGKDPEGYKKREQSLVFSMRNLEPQHSGSVFKTLPGTAGDYTLYQSLAFYVHGDAKDNLDGIYEFVRVGVDTVNFYEYGTKVNPGWKDVRVKLADITNLKILPADTTTIYGHRVAVRKTDTEDGWIAVYGDPSITRVSRIGGGVVNLGTAATSDNALEVWFDDLRLTDVRREMGVAKRISVGAAFSDVMTANLDLKQTDTEFQSLGSTRRGSDDTDLSLSASASLDRFLPALGISLPASMGYHRARSVPTLASRSDIALKGDERTKQETFSVDDNYSLGFSMKRKFDNPLLQLTLNALSGRASYTRRRGISPESADTLSGYTGNLAYSFKPWWDHSLRVFRNYGISYMPEGVDFNLSGSTKNSKQIDLRQDLLKIDRTRQIRGDFSISAKPITGPSLETDYSLKTTRDLDQNKQVAILSSIGMGRELTRNQRAAVTLRPAVGKLLKPVVSYDVNYDENGDPSQRAATDPATVRRASVSSRSNVDLQIQPSTFLSAPGKASDSTGVPIYRRLMAVIPDVDVGYSIDRSSKYNKLTERPDLKFQLGIDPTVEKSIILAPTNSAVQPNDELTRNDGLDFSTEFKPVETVSVTAKYRLDKKLRTYAGATTFDRSTIWPDIAGNSSSSLYLPLFRGALTTSSLTMGYKGTNKASGGGGQETGRSEMVEWLPLFGWDATWKNGMRTTLNLRRTSTTTQATQGTGSITKSVSTSANFSLKHSFTAPEGMRIPLAGRTLRFKSSLTVSLDATYESRLDTTPSVNNRIEKSTRTITISPKASYSFSKNVTGSADARYEQTTDRQLGQTWRTIGLNVSALIRF